MSALVVVPFVLPTVVVALAFLAILPDGVERGWAPILIAHAFFNVAVVVRIVGTFWASLDPRLNEAAAMLGASPRARLREVTAPLLAPALAAAAAIVFLFSFTSFGVRSDPGRPALRDHRGRDLQPGRPPLRPPEARDLIEKRVELAVALGVGLRQARELHLHDRQHARSADGDPVPLSRSGRSDVLVWVSRERLLRDEAVAERPRALVREDPRLTLPPGAVRGVQRVDVEVAAVLVRLLFAFEPNP